jgi:hypothetical protein
MAADLSSTYSHNRKSVSEIICNFHIRLHVLGLCESHIQTQRHKPEQRHMKVAAISVTYLFYNKMVENSATMLSSDYLCFENLQDLGINERIILKQILRT